MAVSRMKTVFHQHIPVLLEEVVSALVSDPNGVYVDATFGRGSHSRAILERLSPKGRLIAFDQDLAAVDYAQVQFADEPRFKIFHRSFTALKSTITEHGLSEEVAGILLDLGVSSPQLDDAARGFSFTQAGPLDMRMDTTTGVSAAEWLAKVEETELANVLFTYGEERFARRIAKRIVSERVEQPITTTAQLAAIIASAIPGKWKDKHPATRSFQAIRIAVNDELAALQQVLDQALAVLKIGGRLAVISFHSLEDRIVKQFIKHHELGGEPLPRGLPIKSTAVNLKSRLKSIGKAIKPSAMEVSTNPRSRSAILRIAEKRS